MRIELSTMRTISSSGLGHVYRRSSMGAAMRRMVERESCFGALQGCNSIVFHRIPFDPPKFMNTMEYVFGILYSPSRVCLCVRVLGGRPLWRGALGRLVGWRCPSIFFF